MFLTILLDGARLMEALQTAIAINPTNKCLYLERGEPLLADVAPHLFDLTDNYQFLEWFHNLGWGNAWGVIVKSKTGFEDCIDHFRKFLVIKTETNQQLYFRFYDPRVLKLFLPTCDPKQLITFFGPVEKFIIEGDTKDEAIEFSQQNGKLVEKVIPASQVFSIQPHSIV